MNQKQFSLFMEKVQEILIKEQDDYRRKKLLKGEKVDILKMHRAINQRKKIKKLTALMHLAMYSTWADMRKKINKFRDSEVKGNG